MTDRAPSWHPQYCATVWPSGDFTLGSLFKVNKSERGEYQHPDLTQQAAQSALALLTERYGLHGRHDEASLTRHAERLESIRHIDGAAYHTGIAVIAGQLPPSALGLSVVSKSHKMPRRSSRRGLKGITAHGRRMVKSCAKLIGRDLHRHTISFGTATVPPLFKHQRELLAKNWPELCRQFMQWIKRRLRAAGLRDRVLVISEVQEERLRDTGEAYPHLHWVCQGKKDRYDEKWAIGKEDLNRAWSRLLTRFTGAKISARQACRQECPRKSLAKEVGKYLSKGGKMIKAAVDKGQGEFLPRAWWQAPLELRRAVKSEIVTLSSEIAYALRANLDKLKALGIATGRVVKGEYATDTGFCEIEFGAVGYFFGDEGFERFLDVWQSLDDVIVMPRRATQNEAAKLA